MDKKYNRLRKKNCMKCLLTCEKGNEKKSAKIHVFMFIKNVEKLRKQEIQKFNYLRVTRKDKDKFQLTKKKYAK